MFDRPIRAMHGTATLMTVCVHVTSFLLLQLPASTWKFPHVFRLHLLTEIDEVIKVKLLQVVSFQHHRTTIKRSCYEQLKHFNDGLPSEQTHRRLRASPL